MLRNEGILLLSSKLIISMVTIIIKCVLCSQRTQVYFGLQQYFVLFTAFLMKDRKYYITFINTLTKICKCLCVASFLVIFTLKIIAPASYQLAFTPSMLHEARLSCDQSINFLDEHGILTQGYRT